jgi:hypothetical protein
VFQLQQSDITHMNKTNNVYNAEGYVICSNKKGVLPCPKGTVLLAAIKVPLNLDYT